MVADHELHHALVTLAESRGKDQFTVLRRLKELLPSLQVANPAGEASQPARTDAQHRALFLWFGMIEKEAENAGLTWDMLIRHTHQLRITKETLHGMCKSLQKALWGTTSTKELKKQGNIDIIVDHFVDVFSKEGLTLPPFPHEEQNTRLKAMENLHRDDYPEMTEELSANKF